MKRRRRRVRFASDLLLFRQIQGLIRDSPPPLSASMGGLGGVLGVGELTFAAPVTIS